VTRSTYIGQALPGGQYGPIDRGMANESVVPFVEAMPESAPAAKKIRLSAVNPEPVSVTVVPTGPCCGENEIIRTLEAGVGGVEVEYGAGITTGRVEVDVGDVEVEYGAGITTGRVETGMRMDGCIGNPNVAANEMKNAVKKVAMCAASHSML
jgi:hypothetical protein